MSGCVAGLILLLDQALKYLVVHVLQLDRVREIDVLAPVAEPAHGVESGHEFRPVRQRCRRTSRAGS
jgi:hypothetical protein